MGENWIANLKTTLTSGFFVFVYVYITKFSQVPLSIHYLQFRHATSSSCKIAESAFFRSTEWCVRAAMTGLGSSSNLQGLIISVEVGWLHGGL